MRKARAQVNTSLRELIVIWQLTVMLFYGAVIAHLAFLASLMAWVIISRRTQPSKRGERKRRSGLLESSTGTQPSAQSKQSH